MKLKICSMMSIMVIGCLVNTAYACDCDTTVEMTLCTNQMPDLKCITKAGDHEELCEDIWLDGLSPVIDKCIVEDTPTMYCFPAGDEACYDSFIVVKASPVFDRECKVVEGPPPSVYCDNIDPGSMWYGKDTTCQTCTPGAYFSTFNEENEMCCI